VLVKGVTNFTLLRFLPALLPLVHLTRWKPAVVNRINATATNLVRVYRRDDHVRHPGRLTLCVRERQSFSQLKLGEALKIWFGVVLYPKNYYAHIKIISTAGIDIDYF
jgi:hypothetical protein